MSAPRVAVIGGGLAGIAAALDCAQAGARVTLVEVRPRLGGAAYSFEREGLRMDNGQHVFLRCCTAYRGLLQRLGSERGVFLQPRLEIPVVSPGEEVRVLRRSSLPAPVHLAGALARYRYLTVRERAGAARAALALGRLDPRARELDERTLGEWLAARGQGPRAVAALWDLIALPTLNLPAAQASLALGAFVFQKGLLERADAGDIGFHRRPLSEIVGDPAERALRAAGVELRMGWRAERVRATAAGFEVWRSGVPETAAEEDDGAAVRAADGERVAPSASGERSGGEDSTQSAGGAAGGEDSTQSAGGAAGGEDSTQSAGGAAGGEDSTQSAGGAAGGEDSTRSAGGAAGEGDSTRSAGGEGVSAEAVIVALPHARAAGLIEPLDASVAARARALRDSPIVNLHVVYDRRVCELPFAAGVGTPVQYVFDRGEAGGVGEGCQYLAVSLSGAEREMGMSVEALRERYLPALAELFPRARAARVERFLATREHAATFRAQPGVGALRPGPRTSVAGLAVAGAWTDTGWPATLEGAVLSGHAAARCALEALGLAPPPGPAVSGRRDRVRWPTGSATSTGAVPAGGRGAADAGGEGAAR